MPALNTLKDKLCQPLPAFIKEDPCVVLAGTVSLGLGILAIVSSIVGNTFGYESSNLDR